MSQDPRTTLEIAQTTGSADILDAATLLMKSAKTRDGREMSADLFRACQSALDPHDAVRDWLAVVPRSAERALRRELLASIDLQNFLHDGISAAELR